MINFILQTKNLLRTKGKNNIFKSLSLLALVMILGVNGVMGQVYQEDFGNNVTVALPYTSGTNATGSVIKNANITTPSWNQNLTSGNFAGNTLGAMSATTGTSVYTITCTFSVNSGFQLNPTSIGFDNRGSSTGPNALTVTISGTGGSTTVSPTPSRTGAFTTTSATNFANTSLNLTGTITLTFAFSGGASGSTERFDNVKLNGNVTASTTAPLAPTMGTITSGNQQLSVAFTAGSNGGAAITNYEYSTNGGSSFSACSPAQTTSPIVITGLTNGTSYNVQIRAVNSVGSGTATGSTAATPYTTPAAPTINSITAGNTQLSVAFTAGNNGGSTITNYKYSTNGGSSFTACSPSQTTSPILITGLTNGTSYDVQILGVNIAGDGTATASTTATPYTNPAAPTINSITEGNTQLSVAFTAGSNGGAAITNYEYSTNGGTSFTACSPAQTTSPIVITGLTNGTSYNVQIRAVNSVGSGTATATTAATPYTNPAAPTINSITAGNTQLSVAFTAGNNGGSTITNYKYSTNGGSSFTACSPSQTTSPIVITGLTNGTSYDVKILAVNIAGDGTASATTTATPVAPASPTISASGSLSALSTTYGTPSSTTSFTVSGATLADDILITPPAGYEISKTSDTSGFATTQTLNQSGGIVNSTTIYVRLAATTAVGTSYNGDIVLSSTGVSPSVTIATSTSTVSTATLTIDGLTGNNKNYDGGTSASVSGTTSFIGLQNGETFSVATTPTYTFASKNIGTGITINQSVPFAAPSSNYTVTQPTLTANIAAATLTITGATVTSKIYDRLTTATVANGTLNGIIGSETVIATTGTYVDKNVGTLKAVTILLTGADAGNYTLTQPNITGDITAKALTITSPAVTSKVFDGTTAATITGTLSGIISPDVVTLVGTGVFASSAQANGISVTSTSTLAGADAGNYTLTQPTGLTGNITAAAPALFTFATAAVTSGTPANLTISNLSNANNVGTVTMISSSSASSGYTGASGTNNAGAAAASGALNTSTSTYFEFTLTPTSGYYVTLSSISFGSRCTGTGPTNYAVRSSADGYSTNVTTGTLSTGGTWALYTPTITSTSSLGSAAITYRIYGYSGTGAAANTIVWRIDDLSLGLTVTQMGTNNWLGASDNLWNNAANWSAGVPNGYSNITISSGNLVLNTNHTIYNGTSLTLSGTSTLTINPTRTLTIAGTADFGGKLVTVKSDATGTGAIGQISGTLSNASNITAERYIPANGRLYRFLSSPVVGGTSLQWRDNAGSTAGRGTHITGLTGIVDSSGTNLPSAFKYTESLPSATNINECWEAIDGNTALVNGMGYRVRIRGDRSISLTTQNTINNATTLWVNGTYPTGTITLPVSYTAGKGDGWNLVGNPYPCTIDYEATSGWNKTNMGTGVAIYRPSTNSYAYSLSTGGANPSNLSINGGSQYIASGQAFFVKANGAGTPSLTCTEAVKVTNQGSPINLFKGVPANQLRLTLTQDSSNSDETIIAFAANYKDAFDNNEDIEKIPNANVNISTVVGIEKYAAINLTSSNYKEKVMPLSVWNSNNGNLQLSFSQLDGFDAGVTVFLKDKFLNTTTAIDQDKTININLTDSSKGDNRFELIFKNGTTNIEQFSNLNAQLTVYPNPAVDVLNININNASLKNSSVTISNVSGKQLISTIMNEANSQINIENLSSGIYFVNITNGNGFNKTVKFVK